VPGVTIQDLEAGGEEGRRGVGVDGVFEVVMRVSLVVLVVVLVVV
jgi:hypothetical protein